MGVRGQAPAWKIFWPACSPVLLRWKPERGRNVWRGGSFNNNRRNARSSYRNNNHPDEQNQNLGFRVAGGCGTGLTACCQSSAAFIPRRNRRERAISTSGPRSRRGQPVSNNNRPWSWLGPRPGPRCRVQLSCPVVVSGYTARRTPARNGSASKICSRRRHVSPCIACPIHACTDWLTVALSISPEW